MSNNISSIARSGNDGAIGPIATGVENAGEHVASFAAAVWSGASDDLKGVGASMSTTSSDSKLLPELELGDVRQYAEIEQNILSNMTPGQKEEFDNEIKERSTFYESVSPGNIGFFRFLQPPATPLMDQVNQECSKVESQIDPSVNSSLPPEQLSKVEQSYGPYLSELQSPSGLEESLEAPKDVKDYWGQLNVATAIYLGKNPQGLAGAVTTNEIPQSTGHL